MNCINCGAALDVSSLQRYIKCQYCGSVVGNFTPFEKADFLTSTSKVKTKESALLKNIALSFKLKDYEDLLENCNKALDISPDLWFAMTYKAIAIFWLGSDDYEHIESVQKTLDRALILSENNEFVLHAVDSIANSMVVLACKHEIAGSELETALKVFVSAKQMGSLHPETDEKMKEFLDRAYARIKKDIESLVQRDGKSMDIPWTTMNRMIEICHLNETKEILEDCWLFGNWQYEKNKTKSWASTLQKEIEAIKIKLEAGNSDVVNKRITFGFLSGMMIN